MHPNDLRKKAHAISAPCGCGMARGFRLESVDPADTLHFTSGDEPEAQRALADGVAMLSALQDRLYAQDGWALPLVFPAIDAAGKDGTIKHGMSGVNPQGCQVSPFKMPSSLDLNHDHLWRCNAALPERGRIGIFNRSHDEETPVVRVHPVLLVRQTVPAQLVGKEFWQERFHDTRHDEDDLRRNGIVLHKVFLHLSTGEQKKRFLGA